LAGGTTSFVSTFGWLNPNSRLVQRWQRVMRPEVHFEQGLESASASTVVPGMVQLRVRLTAKQSAYQ
jgi:hypothetical protein